MSPDELDDDDLSLAEIMADLVEIGSTDSRGIMLVTETGGVGGYWMNVLPLSRRRPPRPRSTVYPGKSKTRRRP